MVRAFVTALNICGVYLLGFNDAESDRARTDVLGYLLGLNLVELLLLAGLYGLCGVIFVPRTHSVAALAFKVSATLATALVFKEKRLRGMLGYVKADIVSALLVLTSGIAFQALLASVVADFEWQKLAAVDTMVTLSLCLLPRFGRNWFATTSGVCWFLAASFLFIGLMKGIPAIDLVASVVLIAFFANVVCICKRIMILNKKSLISRRDRVGRIAFNKKNAYNRPGLQAAQTRIENELHEVIRGMRRTESSKAELDLTGKLEHVAQLLEMQRFGERASLNIGGHDWLLDEDNDAASENSKKLGTRCSSGSNANASQAASVGAASVRSANRDRAGMGSGALDLAALLLRPLRADVEEMEVSSSEESNKRRMTRQESTPECFVDHSPTFEREDESKRRHTELSSNGLKLEHIGRKANFVSQDEEKRNDTNANERRSGSVPAELNELRQFSDLGPSSSNSQQRKPLRIDLGLPSGPFRKRSSGPEVSSGGSTELKSTIDVEDGKIGEEEDLSISPLTANEGFDFKPVFHTGRRESTRTMSEPRGSARKVFGSISTEDGISDEGRKRKRSSAGISRMIWSREDSGSSYLRVEMVKWDFGSGGLFARIMDDKMPSSFSSHPLTTTFMEACTFYDIPDCLGFSDEDVDRLTRYIGRIEMTYEDHPKVQYHNNYHATDVLQAVVSMLSHESVRKSFVNPSLRIFAILFAAAIHDVAHPGRNQAFLVKTQHEWAILYSDRSVLEHHHLAVAFTLLRERAKYNFLQTLDPILQMDFREKVIRMVLNTDLTLHKEVEQSLRALVQSESRLLHKAVVLSNDVIAGFDPADIETDHNVIMCALLHCADVSNVAKPWTVYKEWLPLIFNEFFAQGDEERELGFDVHPNYDRDACHPCQVQSRFIKLFVQDFFELFASWSPEIGQELLPRLQENKQHLKENENLRIHEFQ